MGLWGPAGWCPVGQGPDGARRIHAREGCRLEIRNLGRTGLRVTGRHRGAAAPQEGTRFTLPHSGELYRRRPWSDPVLGAVDGLARFLAPRGRSLVQVALAWVLAQPGISAAIVGASRPQQLQESLAGVSPRLEAEELRAREDVWYALPRERDAGPARR